MNFLYAGGIYPNSMETVHKGVVTEFERIRKDFRAIDFSGNRFYGNIPESIRLLKELRLLNLSGNTFTANIPKSLANLTNLEALDLSRNQLSVPRGTQFQSQHCSSFMDNPKLSGLEEICGATHVLNPTPQESEEKK
ncbi:Receptor-like protein 11 [Cardamine amara subsp. amara]|uniref:Receptor-like protein 11 n=1 Tax=Cardamine amara subsp. amara TaxID=228776 RepID=A0ABD1A929_CARAN